MNKMKGYKFKEWFVFGIGAALMIFQAYKYMKDTLNGDFLDGVVLTVSLLLIFAPKKLVELVYKKADKD